MGHSRGGRSMKALMILLLFCVLNLGYYLYFRRKFVMFSEEILWNTRRIMGNEKGQSLFREYNRETLASKVVMELKKTEEILRNRALITKPALILADEPTGNLDSRTSQEVVGLLQATGKKFRQTIVMITHNDEIAQIADRTIRIEDGRIVEGRW